MSFERFKTQVLLIHSQQGTLDVLSSGFNDSFSVHCETSGTDALNTLGDTPIHVIITAQDLPGMSGLDALREAKKRSPDTIGILLAGKDKSDGLDALVSKKDGFKIYRGEVSPLSILTLVESVINSNTSQIRMLTITESAREQPFDVDSMQSEHIVIETSAHGSTIISDGTANVPVLDPGKIQSSSKMSGRSINVLALTKDMEFLSTIRDSARGLHTIYHAESQEQAGEYVRDHEIGVVVTDAGITGSGIEELIQKLRISRPRLVAIVAGRRDDGEMLMDLINRGHVYRFLLKPVSPGRARLAIEASVKHHQDAPEPAFRTKSSDPASAGLPSAKRKATAASGETSRSASTKSAASSPAGRNKQVGGGSPSTFSNSQMDDGLDDAFESDNSFVETMTDIASALGKSVANAISGNGRGAPRKHGKQKPVIPLAPVVQQKNPAADLKDKLVAAAVQVASRPMLGPKTLGIAGGGIALAAAAAWMVFGAQSTPESMPNEPPASTPQVAQVEKPIAQATVAAKLPPVSSQVAEPDTSYTPPVQDPLSASAPTVQQILLSTARAARDAGNLITPAGNNAVALYLVALEHSPGDPTLQAELNLVVSQVLVIAETAILEQNSERANNALASARHADPDNPHIAFLSAQVSQLGLRAKLRDAQLAIRELRFDDADRLIAEAGIQAGGESVDLNRVVLELTAARNRARVQEILVTAGERLEAGLVINPANDSARFHYEVALAQDPGNQAALQGLTIVASRLVAQAQEAIEQQRFDAADDLLRDAATLNPSSTTLTAAYTTLAAGREAVAEAGRQAEAARVAELERRAELERQAEAARVAELERQAEAERQAELARQEQIRQQAERAEAERVAALELEVERLRQAEIEKQAQLDRLAELERQAEAQRQAELARQAEQARKDELAQLAAAEREAEQLRLAEIARREEDARQAELLDARQRAEEQNASAAAASSVLGVAAATAKTPTRNAAPKTSAPPATNSQAAQNTAAASAQNAAPPPAAAKQPVAEPETTTVVIRELAPEGGLPSKTRQAQASVGLPQFAGSAIASVGGFADSGGVEADADAVLPISAFTRTNYVPPEFPRSAQRRNLSGAVDLEFTVDTNGKVTDVLVVSSRPGETFNQAAMDAVSQWRFQPYVQNGRAVEKRTAVRLSFDLN